jgi:hypothetical protein
MYVHDVGRKNTAIKSKIELSKEKLQDTVTLEFEGDYSFGLQR